MSRTRISGAKPLFLCAFATVAETFAPVIHHLFTSNSEENVS